MTDNGNSINWLPPHSLVEIVLCESRAIISNTIPHVPTSCVVHNMPIAWV